MSPLTSDLIAALTGGGLIGLSALLLWLGLGRIAGISGILASAFSAGVTWQQAFIAGVIVAPIALLALGVEQPLQINSSWGAVITAGLLVGFGSRMGSGCTSGHGICGLGRGSLRSLVATGCFMLCAILTHTLLTGAS